MALPSNWFWIGITGLVSGVSMFVTHRRAVRTWIPVVGEMTSRVASGNSYENLIKYEYPQGQLRFHRAIGDDSKPLARGDFVGLLVNPNYPDQAVVHGSTSGFSVSLVVAIAGAIMASASLYQDYFAAE